MYLDYCYRPWLACASDDTRPVLENVLIERLNLAVGVAVAADGFMMAVVPVGLEPDEPVGLVPGRLLRYAHNCPAPYPRSRGVTLRIEGEMARMPDGSLHPIGPAPGNYPDWRKIVAGSAVETKGEPIRSIRLDPLVLRRLCLALGIDGFAHHPVLRFGGYRTVVAVTASREPGRLEPPYGLLMPCCGLDQLEREPLAAREAAEKPEEG